LGHELEPLVHLKQTNKQTKKNNRKKNPTKTPPPTTKKPNKKLPANSVACFFFGEGRGQLARAVLELGMDSSPGSCW